MVGRKELFVLRIIIFKPSKYFLFKLWGFHSIHYFILTVKKLLELKATTKTQTKPLINSDFKFRTKAAHKKDEKLKNKNSVTFNLYRYEI